MYNRYLAAAEQTAPETSEPPQSSTFSGLGHTLTARWTGNSFCSPPPCCCLGCEYMKKTAAPKFMQQFLFIMLNNGKWRIEDGK